MKELEAKGFNFVGSEEYQEKRVIANRNSYTSLLLLDFLCFIIQEWKAEFSGEFIEFLKQSIIDRDSILFAFLSN